MKRLTLLFFSSIIFLLTLQHCSKSDPKPASVATFPDVKAYFDAAYVAPASFQDNAMTQDIVDGTSALVLKDLVGDNHLTWANDRVVQSPMWPTPPVYHVDGSQGYILIPNVDKSRWTSKLFAKKSQPFDLYVALRDLEAVSFEGYFAVTLGMRNRGDHVEISLTDGSNTVSPQMNTPTLLEFNKISIVRIQFDGANSKLWINNNQVPPSTVNVGTGGINQLGYGTVSHVAQHDFFGMWVKFGKVSDTDHAVIYQALADFYKPGTLPDKPIATNIKATWNNSTKAWEAKYTYQGTNPEDKTKTQYRWGYHDRSQDLNTANLLPENQASGATLTRANFSSVWTQPGLNKVDVFCVVRVFDDKGNSWDHLLRSPPTPDNVP
jgi:hypothetical protein